MAMNGISAKVPAVTQQSRRFRLPASRVALQLLIAFVISWLIILAFFATGVVSH